MNNFYLGGQQAYVNPGENGIWVHDDMGDVVKLPPPVQYNWIEFAINGIPWKGDEH